jgi:hypothetical protein
MLCVLLVGVELPSCGQPPYNAHVHTRILWTQLLHHSLAGRMQPQKVQVRKDHHDSIRQTSTLTGIGLTKC